MKIRSLRMLVAIVAVIFLSAAQPARTEGAEFSACDNCHPGEGTIWCGALVAYTVASCCGTSNQSGWAHCVNDEWGFFVQCEDSFGTRCQCDEWGNNCSRMPVDE